MKTITTIGLAIAALAISATSATAQRFGGGFRASTPTYRAPTPVYRAPAPAYRAPAPTVTYRQPVQAARPVARVAPVAKPRPVVTAKVAVPAVQPRVAAPVRRATARTSHRYGGRSYAWTSPALMPIWWMAAMHRPYSSGAYDDFVRRCIETPRDRRSRECVRALRELGIA